MSRLHCGVLPLEGGALSSLAADILLVLPLATDGGLLRACRELFRVIRWGESNFSYGSISSYKE